MGRPRIVWLALVVFGCGVEPLYLNPPAIPEGAKSAAIISPPKAGSADPEVQIRDLEAGRLHAELELDAREAAIQIRFFGCNANELGVRRADDPEAVGRPLPDTEAIYTRAEQAWRVSSSEPFQNAFAALAPLPCFGLSATREEELGMRIPEVVRASIVTWLDAPKQIFLVVRGIPALGLDEATLVQEGQVHDFNAGARFVLAVAEDRTRSQAWLVTASSTRAESRALLRFPTDALVPDADGVVRPALLPMGRLPQVTRTLRLAATRAGSLCLVAEDGSLWRWRDGVWSPIQANEPLQLEAQRYLTSVLAFGDDDCLVSGICQQPVTGAVPGERGCRGQVQLLTADDLLIAELVPSENVVTKLAVGDTDQAWALDDLGEAYERQGSGQWRRRASSMFTQQDSQIVVGGSAAFVGDQQTDLLEIIPFDLGLGQCAAFPRFHHALLAYADRFVSVRRLQGSLEESLIAEEARLLVPSRCALARPE